jgi:acetyl esterase/lipase
MIVTGRRVRVNRDASPASCLRTRAASHVDRLAHIQAVVRAAEDMDVVHDPTTMAWSSMLEQWTGEGPSTHSPLAHALEVRSLRTFYPRLRVHRQHPHLAPAQAEVVDDADAAMRATSGQAPSQLADAPGASHDVTSLRVRRPRVPKRYRSRDWAADWSLRARVLAPSRPGPQRQKLHDVIPECLGHLGRR